MEVHAHKLMVSQNCNDRPRIWWMTHIDHSPYKHLQISLHLAQDHSLPEPERELVE